MGAILSILTPLISAIAGAFNRYQERAQAAQGVELAKIEAEKQLAMETVRMENERTLAVVHSIPASMRWFSFVFMNSPIIIAVLFPNVAKEIFANLSIVPEFLLQMCVAVNATIWGLPVAAKHVGFILSSVSQVWADRRSQKMDDKIIFEAIRSISGGTLSQAQVDTVNKVLNATRVGK